MIKSLLLATSCVIGSGGGALLKNAPRFSINNTHNNNRITFGIQNINPTQNIKNYVINNMYFRYYNAYTQESTNNSGYAELYYSYTSNCPYYATKQLAVENGDIYYESCQIIKITPQMNFSDLNLNTYILQNDYARGEYGQWRGRYDCYITKDTKVEQILTQSNAYKNSDIWNPLSIFNSEEKNQMRKEWATIEIEFSVDDDEDFIALKTEGPNTDFAVTTINDLQASWWHISDLNWTPNYTINNSKDPIYIIQTAYVVINPMPLTYDPVISSLSDNYMQQITFESYITMNFSNAINPTDPKDYEVIDLSKLLFDIVTLPFTFVSRAFNLTLFPGTGFEFNVSTLFLGIFALLIFAYIIRLVIKFFI